MAEEESVPGPGQPLAIEMGCLLLLVMVIWLFDLGGGSRRPTRRTISSNYLRIIAQGLSQYHAENGEYPPPFLRSEEGTPSHSWRVLLLPATDHPGAYRAYRFEEPWNSARNRSVEVFNVYYDGTDETSEENHWTSYVAVVGDETMWPIEGGLKQTDVSDGLSQTIILVQVAESGIHWREPKDLHLNRMAKEINSKTTKGISSKHAGGAYVAFADGRVRFLSDNTDWRVLKALLTANGGEPLDASFRPRRKPRGSTTQDD